MRTKRAKAKPIVYENAPEHEFNIVGIPTGSGLIGESRTSLKIRMWWNERHTRA